MTAEDRHLLDHLQRVLPVWMSLLELSAASAGFTFTVGLMLNGLAVAVLRDVCRLVLNPAEPLVRLVDAPVLSDVPRFVPAVCHSDCSVAKYSFEIGP